MADDGEARQFVGQMRLSISEIKASNLIDKGNVLDKQDPMISIKIGNKTQATDRKEDSGTNASFPEEFEFEFTAEEYHKGLTMEVVAIHKTFMGKEIVLGSGSVILNENVDDPNEKTGIIVNLEYKDDKGAMKKQGKVVMQVLLDANMAPPPSKSPPAPDTSKANSAVSTKESVPAQDTKVSNSDINNDNDNNNNNNNNNNSNMIDKASSKEKSKELKNEDSSTTKIVNSGEIPHGPLKLKIYSIRASDLINKGNFMDNQDPAVRIKIGGQIHKTLRQKDSGEHAAFPEEFMFDYEEGKNLQIEVEAINENVFGKETSLGKGSASAKHFLKSCDKSFVIEINLSVGSQSQGKVSMIGILFDPTFNHTQENNSLDSQTSKSTKLTLTEVTRGNNKVEPRHPLALKGPHTIIISSIKVKNLVDKSSFIDKQDPMVRVKVGESIFETKHAKDAGTKAAFTEEFTFYFDGSSVNAGLSVEVEVLDHNTIGKDVSLGKGLVEIKNFLKSLGAPEHVSVDLEAPDGSSGPVDDILTFLAVVVEGNQPSSSSSSSSIKPALKSSSDKEVDVSSYPPLSGQVRLKISNIVVRDLIDTGNILDKQDPMLKFKIGNATRETDRYKDGGSKAAFLEEFEYDLEADVINSGLSLEIEAFNESRLGKEVSIGKGSIIIKSFLSALHDTKVVTVELFVQQGKQSIQKGTTTFNVVLLEGLIKSNSNLAANSSALSSGRSPVTASANENQSQKITKFSGPLSLKFSSIRLKHLVDKSSFIDKQDPMVRVKVGKSIFETKHAKDAGTKAAFTEEFTFYFDGSSVNAGLSVEVEVLDHNTIGKDVSLGKGLVEIKNFLESIGETELVSIDLYVEGASSKKGMLTAECMVTEGSRPAADTLVAATAPPSKKDVVMKPSYPLLSGPLFLKISNISVKDLIDKGNFLDKQDPFVKIKIGNSLLETDRQKDGGSEAAFLEEFEYEFDADALNSGLMLEAEVMNRSVNGKETPLGKGQVQIKDFIPILSDCRLITVNLSLFSGGKTVNQGEITMMGLLKEFFDPKAEKKAIAEKAEKERIEAEKKAIAEKAEKERIEAEKKAIAEKAEKERIEAEKKAIAEKAEKERIEAEKKAIAEKAEKERIEAEKKAIADKAEKERIEAEKKAIAEKAEKERMEKDRLAKAEADRIAAEKDRLERARLEIAVQEPRHNNALKNQNSMHASVLCSSFFLQTNMGLSSSFSSMPGLKGQLTVGTMGFQSSTFLKADENSNLKIRPVVVCLPLNRKIDCYCSVTSSADVNVNTTFPLVAGLVKIIENMPQQPAFSLGLNVSSLSKAFAQPSLNSADCFLSLSNVSFKFITEKFPFPDSVSMIFFCIKVANASFLSPAFTRSNYKKPNPFAAKKLGSVSNSSNKFSATFGTNDASWAVSVVTISTAGEYAESPDFQYSMPTSGVENDPVDINIGLDLSEVTPLQDISKSSEALHTLIFGTYQIRDSRLDSNLSKSIEARVDYISLKNLNIDKDIKRLFAVLFVNETVISKTWSDSPSEELNFDCLDEFRFTSNRKSLLTQTLRVELWNDTSSTPSIIAAGSCLLSDLATNKSLVSNLILRSKQGAYKSVVEVGVSIGDAMSVGESFVIKSLRVIGSALPSSRISLELFHNDTAFFRSVKSRKSPMVSKWDDLRKILHVKENDVFSAVVTDDKINSSLKLSGSMNWKSEFMRPDKDVEISFKVAALDDQTSFCRIIMCLDITSEQLDNVDEKDDTIDVVNKSLSEMNLKLMNYSTTVSKDLGQALVVERLNIRKSIEELFEIQTEDLKGKLDRIKSDKAAEKTDTTKVTSIPVTSINLPKNVGKWRCLHVSAWVSYVCDLPEYAATFESASIDGHMLLKYLDEKVLLNDLKIESVIHRVKLMENINSIKAEFQAAADKKRREIERKLADEKKVATNLAATTATTTESIKKRNIVKISVRNTPPIPKALPAAARSPVRGAKGGGSLGPSNFLAELQPSLQKFREEIFNSRVFGAVKKVPSQMPLADVLSIVKASLAEFSQWLQTFGEIERTGAWSGSTAAGTATATGTGVEPEAGLDQDSDPPAYEDIDDGLGNSDNYDRNVGDEDMNEYVEKEEGSEPPPYDEVNEVDDQMGATTTATLGGFGDGFAGTNSLRNVFAAFIERYDGKFNHNDKLTRPKFLQGVINLLRLEISRAQIDSLWNLMDKNKNGSISLAEFEAVFADCLDVVGSGFTRNDVHVFSDFVALLDEFCFKLLWRKDLDSIFGDDPDLVYSSTDIMKLLKIVTGKKIKRDVVITSLKLLKRLLTAAASVGEMKTLIYHNWKRLLSMPKQIEKAGMTTEFVYLNISNNFGQNFKLNNRLHDDMQELSNGKFKLSKELDNDLLGSTSLQLGKTYTISIPKIKDMNASAKFDNTEQILHAHDI